MTPPSGAQTNHPDRVGRTAALQPEQLFRATFEQAAVGIALIETATGRFLRVNHRYCEIVGLSRDDMTATTFIAITHPDDLQADLSNMEKLKAGHIHNFSMEKRYFRPDGSIVWVDLTVAPLWQIGEPPSFHIAVVQDITTRKQAEQSLARSNDTLERQVAQGTRELEESRQQLQAILDGTSDAVFVKDAKGRYQLVNDAAGRFVGKRQEEVIGQDDRFIFPPADAQAVMEGDRNVMTGGVTMTYEEIVTTVDGVRRTFLSTKGPLLDGQGRVTGLFGICRDITERKRAEQALRDRERQLQLSLEASHAGTWSWDLVKDILVWDHRLCALYGIGLDEKPSYEAWRVRVHPLDLPRLEARIQILRQPGSEHLWHEEFRILHPVKGELWIEALGEIERDQAGHAVYFAGINLDVTARKQAEGALRESEERFRRIFEHAATGIAIADLGGRLLQCNPAFCRLVGYTEAELRGMDFRQLVHPEDLTENIGENNRLEAQKVSSFKIENRYRHKDGHDVWVHKFVSMLRDDAGQPTHLFALVTDITERRQMQAVLEQRITERTEALRVSEHFTKEILDSLSAHVAVLDASGVIVAVNRVWERAARLNDPSGRARISLGANYVKVCERAAKKSSEVRGTLSGIVDVLAGRKQSFESEYLCAWPEYKQWFSMRVTPLIDRGGCVITHEDITARKRAEETVQQSYHRLQTLSHEVQVAEERERSRLSRELHDEFGQLLSVLKFSLGLTEQRLQQRGATLAPLAKQVSGALDTVDRLFVSLRSMVAAGRPPVLEHLGLIAAIKAVVVEIGTVSDLRCRVLVKRKGLPTAFPVALEGALYRITQELLTNVVRHANATEAVVTLGCANRKVELTVQDNGHGFTPDQSESTSRFGLRGIRERTELLGGGVEIHSRPGRTAVTVSLPLGGPSSDHDTTVSSPAPKRATRKKGRNYVQGR